MTILILFATLFLFILLSVPVGISIGLSTIITIYFASDIDLSTIIQKIFSSLDSFAIMAIPFFMFAGLIMGRGGISRRLVDFANSLVGWMVGGLAMVTTVTSMFFAAISGSGPATVAAIGSFMIPEMEKKRYGIGLATGLTAAAGTIGVIIPPSIPFILYGVVGEVSIGDLFIAGILPGIFIGITLMVTSFILIKRKGITKKEDLEVISFKKMLKTGWDAKWSLLTPVIILGGIYGGVFTPTEASVVAVVYGLLIGGFVYKELKWKEIYECTLETLRLMGATLYMIGLSVAFSFLLTVERIPSTIADGIIGFSDNPIIIMLLINVFLLVVGAFVDAVASIVILTPILLPIVMQIGVDPVHFGIILVANLAIGYITPPVGVNLFVSAAVGKTNIETVVRGILPFFIALLISLIFITYMPSLSLLLIGK